MWSERHLGLKFRKGKIYPKIVTCGLCHMRQLTVKITKRNHISNVRWGCTSLLLLNSLYHITSLCYLLNVQIFLCVAFWKMFLFLHSPFKAQQSHHLESVIKTYCLSRACVIFDGSGTPIFKFHRTCNKLQSTNELNNSSTSEARQGLICWEGHQAMGRSNHWAFSWRTTLLCEDLGQVIVFLYLGDEVSF